MTSREALAWAEGLGHRMETSKSGFYGMGEIAVWTCAECGGRYRIRHVSLGESELINHEGIINGCERETEQDWGEDIYFDE